MTFLLALLATVEAGECEAQTNTSQLVSALETAETAYGDLDVPSFQKATDDASKILPCVSDKVTRHLAAEYHRFMGLRAFIDRDAMKSTQAFAAARAIEPDYKFPESLVPAGNPVLEDYVAIDPASGKTADLPEPKGGYLAIDGRQGSKRSKSFPSILQIFDDGGKVVSTSWLMPADPAPTYEVATVAAADPEPDPKGDGGEEKDPKGDGAASNETNTVPKPGNDDKAGPNVPLLVGAGVAVVVAGGMYAVAGSAASDYRNNPHTADELETLKGRANTFVIASGATAGVAVGLGVTSVLVSGRW